MPHISSQPPVRCKGPPFTYPWHSPGTQYISSRVGKPWPDDKLSDSDISPLCREVFPCSFQVDSLIIPSFPIGACISLVIVCAHKGKTVGSLFVKPVASQRFFEKHFSDHKRREGQQVSEPSANIPVSRVPMQMQLVLENK